MDMHVESKCKQRVIIQDIRLGQLKATDSNVPAKVVLSGNTAGELIADLFG
jgi:hypothetical protein